MENKALYLSQPFECADFAALMAIKRGGPSSRELVRAGCFMEAQDSVAGFSCTPRRGGNLWSYLLASSWACSSRAVARP